MPQILWVVDLCDVPIIIFRLHPTIPTLINSHIIMSNCRAMNNMHFNSPPKCGDDNSLKCNNLTTSKDHIWS